MKPFFLTTAIAAALVLNAADATAAGHREAPDFATLDTDGNGALTLEELQAAGEARFAAVDTDGNGTVSAEELTAHMQSQAAERVERMIARLDANEDGVLSMDEMQPRGGERRAERMFSRIDVDEDGQISAEEFEDAREHMARHGGRRGGGKGFGGRG